MNRFIAFRLRYLSQTETGTTAKFEDTATYSSQTITITFEDIPAEEVNLRVGQEYSLLITRFQNNDNE